ncbi:MAG: hypothetical protein QQN41_02440, partial [Nitrosopumilus sp.]
MLQTRIIPSKPALILEGEKKSLIVTDIHIGFENTLASNEIFIGKNSTINETIQELLEMIESVKQEEASARKLFTPDDGVGVRRIRKGKNYLKSFAEAAKLVSS